MIDQEETPHIKIYGGQTPNEINIINEQNNYIDFTDIQITININLDKIIAIISKTIPYSREINKKHYIVDGINIKNRGYNG